MFHKTIRVRAVVDGTHTEHRVRQIQFGSRSSSDAKYANVGVTPTPNVPVTNIALIVEFLFYFYNHFCLSSMKMFQHYGSSSSIYLPTGNVTISNIVSSDLTEAKLFLPNGGGGSITNRTLVFIICQQRAVMVTNTTTGGWNMPQTITIRSVADGFDDGDIPFKITFPMQPEQLNMLAYDRYPQTLRG
ncbi:MAG: hypothetical protein IPH52_20020 [Leptospiraceae bacterium]|nr:hypothetical protein [Leptospiraceae bacterium]